ncbi:hypothetical protein BH11MYX4_BH11MYX4_31710 [soil metagenome]
MRLPRLAAPLVLALAAACADTQDFRTTPSPPTDVTTPAPPATLPPAAEPGVTAKAVVLASDQGLYDEDPDRQGPMAVVTDATWVYWLDVTSHLARVPKAGGKVESLADTSAMPYELALAGDHLYFTDVPDERIVRLPTSGGTVEGVTPATKEEWRDIQHFVVDGPRITWVDGLGVRRCEAIPCAAVKELPIGSNLRPVGLATYGEHVFVPYMEVEPLYPNQLRPGGIANATGGGQVDTLPLYYTAVLAEPDLKDPRLTAVYAATNNLILQADWPGGFPPRVLVSGTDADSYPASLQIAGAYLYFLNRGSRCTACKTITPGSIMRVKKDGSERPEQVYAAEDALNALVVDASGLYVTTNGGRVLRVPRPADGPLR